ncbi:trans-aconitate 2-methyltransferase [Longimycelium tulufanense]|uniref:Trans-aconitate 2-methyltransferase n=1 Tax=Longimycelium tulufanense TaxID=907463 RepID=A0A8J3CK99_9PSEU|nr:trans-aconitate 2-methyltransferase [Longimycelium tulufanense]GGM82858.1 trans-aconitate 2-methyltransferase [Longimycelium tulufanense]
MWDPDVYLAFAKQRSRPFRDLMARVFAEDPRRVVDLGCGAGNLTRLLRERWPTAVLEALDSSPEMVDKARANGVDAYVADVADWKPETDTDVVVSSAVLQWVPAHVDLIGRWLANMSSGAWFAMHVPANYEAPSHHYILEMADEPRWRDELADVQLLRPESVLDPGGYAAVLADAGCEVDAWETTYLHQLSGTDPVLEWVSGTALRPVRAQLGDRDWEEFRTELGRRLRRAYPPWPGGSTWVPFRRVFAVARKR